MKERELTESHDADIYEADTWDAVGEFILINGEERLFIELTLDDDNYVITRPEELRLISDLERKFGTPLHENFRSTIQYPDGAFKDWDYVLFIEVNKDPQKPKGSRNTIYVSTNLKKVDGGKPFFIALHVDRGATDKKYRRKTSANVGNQIPKVYILNSLIG